MPTGDAYSSGHLVPSLLDLYLFYLLRPILFPNLSLLFRTMLFEYPSVLSRFCFNHTSWITGNYSNWPSEVRPQSLYNRSLCLCLCVVSWFSFLMVWGLLSEDFVRSLLFPLKFHPHIVFPYFTLVSQTANRFLPQLYTKVLLVLKFCLLTFYSCWILTVWCKVLLIQRAI